MKIQESAILLYYQQMLITSFVWFGIKGFIW